MFKKGDLVVYSSHGICNIDSIYNMDILGESKPYYLLHPIEDTRLNISVPVDSKKVMIRSLVNKEEAEDIINSFSHEGAEWIDMAGHRQQAYTNILKSGSREDISRVLNTLMKREQMSIDIGKSFNERDTKLLKSIKTILFKEISLALDTTVIEVEEKIREIIFQ